LNGVFTIIIQPNVSIVYDDHGNSYQVLNFIGNGSFGYVYELEREIDKSKWALKTLTSNFPDPTQLLSFNNECALATKVSHENAAHYLYVHDGTKYTNLPPYIIMAYANGGTMQNVINATKDRKELLDNQTLIDYFNQLINGMEHINSILVHRDIKPDNILIHDGVLKISDFGLSKIVNEGTRQHTFKGYGHLKYLAPEGWKQEKNTIQMDIYSMGLTFYELATLRYPYEVRNEGDVQSWKSVHLFSNPQSPRSFNPSLTSTLTQVILKMLEKTTAKRYKNWDEIRNDLLIDSMPLTVNSSIVNNMINLSVARESLIKEEQLKKEKLREEKLEYVNTIRYQYENDIYTPLRELVEEYNIRNTGESKIQLTPLNNSSTITIETSIRFASGKEVTIKLRYLFDEDFVREVIPEFNPFQETRVKRIVRPELRKRKILAWGYLEDSQDLGFNILLLENTDEIYGEWVILWNTNNGFSREARPEPFPFGFNEIEKEVQYIGATHIYKVEVKELNKDLFYEFLASNIM